MPPSIEKDLQRLEVELKQLEAEYNMFFSGRLPKPPWETRARVEAMVTQYDRAHIPNTGDRFRFSTLQSRYQTFIDLWDRGMRAREEGRPGPFAQKRPTAAAEPKRPEDRILHVAAFRDPVREVEKLTELYESLAEARTAGRSLFLIVARCPRRSTGWTGERAAAKSSESLRPPIARGFWVALTPS